MHNAKANISAQELVHNVIPKLRATEKLVSDALLDMIKTTNDEEERNRRTLQQQEFELEVTMIRMNLDHLMERYAKEIQEVVDSADDRPGALLQLDQHERFAIESARQLYDRVQTIQTA